jgi:hypothetical protein
MKLFDEARFADFWTKFILFLFFLTEFIFINNTKAKKTNTITLAISTNTDLFRVCNHAHSLI